MSENTPANQCHAIPREQIDWHPLIVAKRCAGCGTDAISCGKGIYTIDYGTNLLIVLNNKLL